MNLELFRHYYSFFKRLAPDEGEIVWLSGAHVVCLSQEGHSCLPLEDFENTPVFDDGFDSKGLPSSPMPVRKEWRKLLSASSLVGNSRNVNTPLILDEGDRLYLGRNYDYECRLVREIVRRVEGLEYSGKNVAEPLEQLFGGLDPQQADWQRIAAATAALRKLCIVSGGPGTGKTYVVVNIMALLQMLEPDKTIRFGLAAPTGKAAKRLHESIAASLDRLPSSVQQSLSTAFKTQTIHRLLGTNKYSPNFKHNKENSLSLDVLIVDEVSMVDLALMVKLLEALPDHARIIMLGDKDQLSSIEAGRVLADICEENTSSFSASFSEQLVNAGAVAEGVWETHEGPGVIDDCLIHLKRSYRFGADSLIGRLSQAILGGNVDKANTNITGQNILVEAPSLQDEELAQKVISGFTEYLDERDPSKALRIFNSYRLLCAHRYGRWGVQNLNQWVESVLIKANKIQKQGEWYAGRPVMISGNHYALGLFNGDTGLALRDGQGQLRVWFEGDDGQAVSYSPARIPCHETAYALTVHKSQGSEFDHAVLVLPDQSSRLITRELLYTAITRAKKSVEIWGNKEVFEEGIQNKIQRNTGLSEKLKSAEA